MTAVERLLNDITPFLSDKILNFFSKIFIKSMIEEKQQIKDAYNQGFRDALEMDNWKPPHDIAEYVSAENYYNENFNK